MSRASAPRAFSVNLIMLCVIASVSVAFVVDQKVMAVFLVVRTCRHNLTGSLSPDSLIHQILQSADAEMSTSFSILFGVPLFLYVVFASFQSVPVSYR